MTRQPSTREPRTAAERLMADPDYSRMTDVERVAWLKGWDAAIEAEQRRVAALEDERDSFKRLMLVAGGRVTALNKGLRALLDADDGVSWTALEAARDKARALLAESEASDE